MHGLHPSVLLRVSGSGCLYGCVKSRRQTWRRQCGVDASLQQLVTPIQGELCGRDVFDGIEQDVERHLSTWSLLSVGQCLSDPMSSGHQLNARGLDRVVGMRSVYSWLLLSEYGYIACGASLPVWLLLSCGHKRSSQ